MADHLDLTPHLHDAGFEAGLRETFLGQAHIAGTGPAEATCRECKLWGLKTRKKDEEPCITPPGYFGKRAMHPGNIKRANCNYIIAHKAKRRVPHNAKACRFFDPSDNPPPERNPEQ